MNISIILEKEVATGLNVNGEVIQMKEGNTSKENPIFINRDYGTMLMVYVNEKEFKLNEQKLLDQIAEFINSLEEVFAISVPSEIFKEPVISAIAKARKKGFSITGDYTLSVEEYEFFKDTEVINVAKCDDSLSDQPNLFLTSLIGYKSNDIFSSENKIKDAQKERSIKIGKPLTLDSKNDLELFFQWNRNLESVELSNMTAIQYVEVIQFLKPFLNKIPKIKLDVSIKDNSVLEMRQIEQILKEQSDKVVVEYQTHLTKDKRSKNQCSLMEYIVMDEILSFYQTSIESHNYSPLEKLVYAYDIVKNVSYQEVVDDTDRSKSRDLHYVVLGDKIVCVGYSSLLNGLLTKLNIPATEYSLSIYRNSEEEEHQRSVIYLQDSKYGINGLFVCDPTWDEKSSVDIGYDRPIDRYNYFLLPYDKMEYGKELENVNVLSALSLQQDYLETMKNYDLYQNQLIDLNEKLGLIDTTRIIDEGELKNFSGEKKSEMKRNTLYSYIKEQISNFKQEIPFETIAAAIETVRRTEEVYMSEAELGKSIVKIIELHEQFKKYAFNEEKTMYIKQNGNVQILASPAGYLNKRRLA